MELVERSGNKNDSRPTLDLNTVPNLPVVKDTVLKGRWKCLDDMGEATSRVWYIEKEARDETIGVNVAVHIMIAVEVPRIS